MLRVEIVVICLWYYSPTLPFISFSSPVCCYQRNTAMVMFCFKCLFDSISIVCWWRVVFLIPIACVFNVIIHIADKNKYRRMLMQSIRSYSDVWFMNKVASKTPCLLFVLRVVFVKSTNPLSDYFINPIQKKKKKKINIKIILSLLTSLEVPTISYLFPSWQL